MRSTTSERRTRQRAATRPSQNCRYDVLVNTQEMRALEGDHMAVSCLWTRGFVALSEARFLCELGQPLPRSHQGPAEDRGRQDLVYTMCSATSGRRIHERVAQGIRTLVDTMCSAISGRRIHESCARHPHACRLLANGKQVARIVYLRDRQCWQSKRQECTTNRTC
jgi:hypothetical protein